MSSQILKYRINSITSQSPNYPASNLTDQNTTLGWQSQYSPLYPQQINIQFFTPIKTKTMKITFHQYKIPSCVQVFVRLTAKQNYRKLGYIIPNDNSQSSFQHKQIKTLYFQFPCNYIKLVFYQNYKNQMNIFQQVAIDQLAIQGQALTYNQLKNLDFTQASSQQDSQNQIQNNYNKNPNKQNINKNKSLPQTAMIQTQSMDQLNKQFQQIYSYLQQQKSQAVQNQDFRLASNLKNVILTFKTTQQQIINLQLQKQQALSEQDFDKCHQIKQLIKKKKQQFQFRVQQLTQNQDAFVAQHSHSRIIHDPAQSTERKGPYQGNYNIEAKTDIKNYFNNTPERQPLSNANQSKNIPKKSLQRDNKPQSQPNKPIIDHNEQIIPALKNKMMGKKPQDEYQYPPQTGRSQYEQLKNKSSLGNKSQLTKKNNSKSPQNNKHRSKSPPKSPRQKIIQTPNDQNISIKSPILTYQSPKQQQTYERQTRPKSPSPDNHLLSSPDNHLLSSKPTLSQLQQRFRHLQLEQLDVKLRLKLQSHFQKIQQPYWQMIMNKSWNVKKMALTYILQNIPIQDKQTYMASMQFISFSINDPHPQVILSSLHVLRKIIQEGIQNNVEFTLPHMPYFIETIVSALLNLINSTNKQLCQQAYNLYLQMGMISFLTIQYLVQKIIKHKQTTKISPQYTLIKISLMISLIQKYSQTTKYYKEITLWCIQFLKDPNNKVRSQASNLLMVLLDVIEEDKIFNVLCHSSQYLQLYQQLLNNHSQLVKNSRIDNGSSLIQGSRINQRSKLQQNISNYLSNKSLSKQKLNCEKNKSQVSPNPSGIHQSKQQNNLSYKEKEKQSSSRLKNPWNDKSKQESKFKQNSKSRMSSQKFDDQELQYSKQSDFYGSSIKKENPSQLYGKRAPYLSQNSEGQIRVLDQQEQYKIQESYRSKQQNSLNYEQEHQDDGTKCDYCFMDMQGMDQRQHLLKQCKVLVSCQQCMGRIYLRQIIDHLLRDCNNKTHHQQCRKCGLVFNIHQINQHVGQGMCRLQRGQGWERCQFCGQDVMASDMKWVEHAYKCPNLPQVPLTEPTQKTSQHGDDD